MMNEACDQHLSSSTHPSFVTTSCEILTFSQLFCRKRICLECLNVGSRHLALSDQSLVPRSHVPTYCASCSTSSERWPVSRMPGADANFIACSSKFVAPSFFNYEGLNDKRTANKIKIYFMMPIHRSATFQYESTDFYQTIVQRCIDC